MAEFDPKTLGALNASLLDWTPNQYIKQSPTPKQRAFLCLPHHEVLFGGSAGPGKSSALLMSALQYCHLPNYNAIIFRRTYADLSLPGALIPRSHEWLQGSGAKWNQTHHEWRFPSGAKLAFGYLEHETDKYRYQGAEFQFLGVDELTQIPEDDYLYLHSRVRRNVDSVVPLRIRCATNPGGLGHAWVRKRWNIGPAGTDEEGNTRYIGRHPTRKYIPALLKDNPFLSREEYESALSNLDPVTRAQLLRGDWGVSADGRFRKTWAQYFTTRGPWYILGPDGKGEAVHGKDVEIFMIVDPAASAKQGPGDSQIWRKAPSSTVIGIFARTFAHNHMLWLDCDYGRWEIPMVLERIIEMHNRWSPETIGIEASGLGIGVVTTFESAGLPIKRLNPQSQDKLVRATDACNRMERGRIWLPQTAPWLEYVENELFTWTGHPDEPDDVVDVIAYAAKEVSRRALDQASLLGVTTRYCSPSFVGGDGSGFDEARASFFFGGGES